MTQSFNPSPPVTLGNRRAERRAELDAPVMIDAGRSYYTGRSRDVSSLGLGVVCEAEIAVGGCVDVYFELPTGIAIEARAQVVRRASGVLGLKFVALANAERAALQQYGGLWRRALLEDCARRAQLMDGTHAPVAAVASDLEGFEAQSGVRLRAVKAQ